MRIPANPASWDLKGKSDFVTSVDRRAERLITDRLRSQYPRSTVVGEELNPATAAAQSGLTWIVDPLDGTTNFLHGYPAYAVSIAAVVDGELEAAVVVHVPDERTYVAMRGLGAWCQSERLSVSHTEDPAYALLGTGYPFKALQLLPRYLRQFSTVLSATSGVRRAGSAALDLVDVARGRFDGFWELTLEPWDVAAGTLLVREAGGVVTDLKGDPNVVRQGAIVAGNSAMHAWLLDILRD